jgi:hypothetical protein
MREGMRELRRSDILWGMKLGIFTRHHSFLRGIIIVKLTA